MENSNARQYSIKPRSALFGGSAISRRGMPIHPASPCQSIRIASPTVCLVYMPQSQQAASKTSSIQNGVRHLCGFANLRPSEKRGFKMPSTRAAALVWGLCRILYLSALDKAKRESKNSRLLIRKLLKHATIFVAYALQN
jgi:hypothetical protein